MRKLPFLAWSDDVARSTIAVKSFSEYSIASHCGANGRKLISTSTVASKVKHDRGFLLPDATPTYLCVLALTAPINPERHTHGYVLLFTGENQIATSTYTLINLFDESKTTLQPQRNMMEPDYPKYPRGIDFGGWYGHRLSLHKHSLTYYHGRL